jgi:hypothetical protein
LLEPAAELAAEADSAEGLDAEAVAVASAEAAVDAAAG